MNKITCIVLLYTIILISCQEKSIESRLEARVGELESQLDTLKKSTNKTFDSIRNFQISSNKKNFEFNKKTEILKKLNLSYDDKTETTSYDQNLFIHYNNLNRSSISLHKKSGQSPTISLKMTYAGDDWIQFENAYFIYDSNVREIKFNLEHDKLGQNAGGQMWEWIDISLGDNDIDVLYKVANSSNSQMKLSGKKELTRNLFDREKEAILHILNAYQYFKENPNENL
ncbi:hypothetical protein ACFRAE_04070 [Sphingobacterium sp. HJSM2_6]|uniref:hypothetical protein n=1 Tax=Sphingobacterium sp. HJSM2_6 TaxID=3366264 RepID=UPI003BD5CC80